jgi:hypothetical protein
VFKLNQGTLTLVQATVTNGQAVISFSTDPDFIVATPSAAATGSTASTTTTSTTSGTVTTTTKVPVLGKNQRAIFINGKAIIVPVVVKNNTTYMPIWYVGEVLKELGDQYRWDGHNWHITTPKTVQPNFSQRKPGHGTMSIYLNNVLVQHVTGLYAKDPGSGKLTTYMPIWYVMQVLKRVHIPTTWNGKDWGFPGSNKS